MFGLESTVATRGGGMYARMSCDLRSSRRIERGVSYAWCLPSSVRVVVIAYVVVGVGIVVALTEEASV